MMMNKNDARIEMSLWSGVIKNKYIKNMGQYTHSFTGDGQWRFMLSLNSATLNCIPHFWI